MDNPNAVLELRFHEAMMGVYEDAKSRVGYVATRFLQMVRRRGGLAAARQLLAQEGVSAGFLRLRDAGALYLSMEYVVLEPYFKTLFTDAERQVARDRLLAYGLSADRLPS
jgi:hypothetical protein